MRSHLILAALLLATSLTAQQPDQPLTTLKLATRLVPINAVVLDERGDPVRGLTQEDFVLKQDGKDQPIRYFSQDSTQPLTLALLVDTSGSQKMFIQDEIMASERFFRAMLTRTSGPNPDRAALVQFDTTVLERAAMTASVQTLENSLNFLSMPHPTPSTARGGTLLYDAVCAAASSFPGNERGRRAMVLLTDGEDNGSRATLDFALASAQRADIVVYSILYSAEQFVSGMSTRQPSLAGPSGRRVLESLSNATGGRVFQVAQKSELDRVYAEIADDLRLQYQLAYTPPEGKPGSYHKLELKTAAKHLTVHARQGFYTPK